MARKHGYAAFAREDVADARAGRPPDDLEAYARSRGLEWLDRQRAAGFAAAVPGFAEYRFDVMRGVLPGGRHGVLLRELLEVPVTGSPNVSGTLHGTVVRTPGSWLKAFVPNRTDIPIIGNFLDPPTDTSPVEAFESNAVWIPTTTVGVSVPETALPLFLVRIDRRHKHAPFDFDHRADLGDHGLAGWRLRSHGAPVDPDVLDRMLSPAMRDVLARHTDDAYFGLLFLRGTLVVRRNGFVSDADALDALCADACAVADAATAACAPLLRPQPFAEPLPAPHSEHPDVLPSWRDGYAALADRLGLTLEDPDDYQRAYAALGVPGRVVAVMRGDLGGVTGRLVYTCELNLRASERARGVVLLPAPPGLPPTPPGGIRDADALLVHEQRGDVTVLWSLRTAGFFREEQEELIERALAYARARGLVGEPLS